MIYEKFYYFPGYYCHKYKVTLKADSQFYNFDPNINVEYNELFPLCPKKLIRTDLIDIETDKPILKKIFKKNSKL